MARVAFELQCPPERITLQALNRHLDNGFAPELDGDSGAQVGVSGCGKRAVYVYSKGAGWVLNSDSQPERR